MRLFKHLFPALCISFGAITPAIGQYTLTVESSTPVVAPGTVYRIYADMIDATDRMSAVFGNNENTLNLSAPDGVFNSTYNASWSASGIVSAFLPIFPEMADDTYATIGLDGPASESSIPNSADPSLVEDTSQPIIPFFTIDGETTLLSNTLTVAFPSTMKALKTKVKNTVSIGV